MNYNMHRNFITSQYLRLTFYYILFYCSVGIFSKVDVEKIEFCSQLKCDEEDAPVCGMRSEGDGFRLKLFQSECELLKYGCGVKEEQAYGLINKEYCEQSFATDTIVKPDNHTENDKNFINVLFHNKTSLGKCNGCTNDIINEVCGIREDGIGYRIKLFSNKCELEKYNCDNDLNFTQTDLFICKPNENTQTKTEHLKEQEVNDIDRNVKNLVVINGGMLGSDNDINDTIDSFFAASHVFDLPLKEVETLNTRRRLLKNAGPVTVFVPWIVKPKDISNDTFHQPTLSSCYHKCPTKCPDTYAPVCGVPGIVAREPSIIFQNHCFMDVAQCKMFWEKKSSTAHSSSYLEASFLFCMGDEMNAVYRFLPAIRTLQHMGRLKKKSHFRYRLRNFRYLTEFRAGRPKFMG